MSKRWYKCGIKTWIAGGGLIAILTALAVVVATVSVYANSNTSHSTAWYAESATPAVGHPMASHATAAVAANYATAMSKAFHDAASRVLPSVVMITNTPAAAQTSGNRKSLPDDNSEEMPFGFKGTPFGDLFNGPEPRQFPLSSLNCNPSGVRRELRWGFDSLGVFSDGRSEVVELW